MRRIRQLWQRALGAMQGRLAPRALVAASLGCLLLGSGLMLFALGRSGLEAPDATLLLRDRQGRFLGVAGEAEEGGLGYWPLGAVPERVAVATMVVEDRRFWSHPGVDFLAAGRALWQNLRHGERISGASTLPMQVARMQRPGDRTYPRKALESLTALLFTARHGREAVLRHYLRIVPYSNRIHGIRYAARRYLDKPVEDLSWAETAFLAAIPQSPARMNPFEPRGRARAIRRGLQILDLLTAEGFLGRDELELARAQLRRLRIPPRGRRPEEAIHALLRTEAMLQEAGQRLRAGGDPIVRSTLDLELQAAVSEMAWDKLEAWRGRGAGNIAALVVDLKSWEVRAAVSSVDYFAAGDAGSIDYLRVPRSAGSTLKPFLFGLALDRGVITPSQILDDLARGSSAVGNSDGRFLGPLLPRVALANSRNVPAADLLNRLGMEEGYAFLSELGLHEGHLPARHYGLGLAIGGLPVALEDLVRAYTVLAGDGRLRQLAWFEGQELVPPRRLLSEATARRISLFLSDPQARLPTFPRMGASEFPYAVALKTGTSSRYRDAWTVAYSQRYLVGVWVGHPDHRPMARLSGYRSAALLVRDVMDFLHGDLGDGLSDLSFPAPRGHRSHRVCALSGQRAGQACETVFLEWLVSGEAAPEECGLHRHLAIDRRNGLLATSRTPVGEIEVRPFADLPARYAEWAAGAGVPLPPLYLSPLGEGDVRQAQVATLAAASAASLRGGQGPAEVRLEITSPGGGSHLLIDPEMPQDLSTVALSAVVEPPVEQVLWMVDGQPFRTAEYPYTLRWPLTPGEHRFQVRLPYGDARSAVVRITVE